MTMSTLATIDQFNQAFNQHDVDAVMALMTADCIFENTYPGPDGTRYQGQATVRQYWAEFFNESPQSVFEAEEIFVHEDRGVVRWIYRWVDAETKPGHVRGVDIMRVQDGKVAEKLSYVKG